MLDTVIWWTGAAVLGGEASVPASEPAASSAGADTPPVFDPTAWLKVQSQLAWMLRGYNANVAELKRLQAELLEAWQQGRMKAAQELSAPGANAALQGRAPDTPPADPERYAAAGSIPAGSAGEDTPSVWEQSPARPGVQHYTETLAQLPDVQSRLAWLLRGLPKQTKPLEIGVPPALIQEAYDALERLKAELKCWTQGRADLQPVDSDYNNALIGIRWALQDLGLRVKSDPEATKSAVEVLCVQLRKEGRAWTGEMLGGLTCPSQMQKEDNAALKQRVFTALGERLVRGLSLPDGDLSGVAEAIAQFDLLSHSVKGDSKWNGRAS